MRTICLLAAVLLLYNPVYCWGFFAHEKINGYAVYLLPPEMLVFYKPSQAFLQTHATDPDKRRYVVKAEGPRHFIDLDQYGQYPFTELPRKWEDARKKFGEDSLQQHGILPWRILQVLGMLTSAFRGKNTASILKLSADLGHYIGDAHVPLHTSSNHNGQKTNQHGIHGFWESRLPELLADQEWDFFLEKASYIPQPAERTWQIILESAAAVDSVLELEAILSKTIPPDQKFAFEWRKQTLVRQYSSEFSRLYNQALKGMVERRMRQSVQAVADYWYTAWVNAGQPSLQQLVTNKTQPNAEPGLDSLSILWRSQPIKGKSCD
ncbi:zinc dependent phospholipase C family protein [Flavihumibacter sp. RY-1]|uniref:Zinc dependent phospholipase C family protein n=1 Tax=Flavihumibacter fluminis TaxID=2909236 RepID=A0ABS9BKJ4_9BACT|nr:zinc dependent phospholipase C family protein [Flavihumibacter fluminis]MCF1715870.1 zinc dependent phospholipase C family protein [Flavihumibacter fluminis]